MKIYKIDENTLFTLIELSFYKGVISNKRSLVAQCINKNVIKSDIGKHNAENSLIQLDNNLSQTIKIIETIINKLENIN